MGKVDEASIIELLKLGWNNEMIADKLGIGPDRVRRVRKKTGSPQAL